jgi:predicted CoA-binding protein
VPQWARGLRPSCSMKHMTRDEALIQRLLRRSRTIAVLGASPKPERHSGEVVSYLHKAGYDVIPIRPDRATIAGLPTYARLDDLAGSVDLAVIFRRPDAVSEHIREAVAKRAEAVWLPPGAWSPEAEREAGTHQIALVRERCIVEEHRRWAAGTGELTAGHPKKLGVHMPRRKATVEDNRARREERGYVAGGGGGHASGGGVRAILDEKKMVTGRPSRRSGPMKQGCLRTIPLVLPAHPRGWQPLY